MRAKDSRLGLTLPEVVIAIAVVFVLAAILIPPGPCQHRPRGPAVRAVSEIRNTELALTKILSDANQTQFRALFEDAAFDDAVQRLKEETGMDAFAASAAIYTDCTYALLHHGRNAADHLDAYKGVLRHDVIQRLGATYYTDLDTDPWGNRYQVFAGPWPEDMGPTLFRQYLGYFDTAYPLNGAPMEPDALVLGPSPLVEGATYGWPARSNLDFYVWSFGENGVSDQPRYDPTHEYAAPVGQYYNANQDEEYWGGGDDINNWDREQTYMRHYN